jgi:adenylyltransferase/sulfurtransferase
MPSPPTPLPPEIDCRTVKQMLDAREPLLLLDCRETDEHARAAIAGAMLVPMSEITQRVAELEPHRQGRIVVHCHHGGRSLRVAHWLRQQGFAQAQSMSGGIDRWAVEIDPNVPRY